MTTNNYEGGGGGRGAGGAEKKKPPHGRFFSGVSLGLFSGDDSLAGANFCACAAFDACIGIDNIDFTFADCLYRAVGKTCAASYTFVSNNVSHS